MGGGRRQGADMHAHNEDLSIANNDVAFFELDMTRADGFDFPPLQHEPGLEPFFDEIVVRGFAVLNDAHERIFLQTVKLEHSILSQPKLPYRCTQFSAPF